MRKSVKTSKLGFLKYYETYQLACCLQNPPGNGTWRSHTLKSPGYWDDDAGVDILSDDLSLTVNDGDNARDNLIAGLVTNSILFC